jgi:hypothetical protein
MDSTAQAFAGLGMIGIILGFIIGVLWLLVPFAIFGIKPLLRSVVKHLEVIERQNAALVAASGTMHGVPLAVGGSAPAVDGPVTRQL